MRLPRIITDDWPRKLTALFFAALIWLSVNNQLQDRIVLKDVPVVLEYDPNSVVPESDLLTVDVKVRGQSNILQTMQTSDINIRANIGPVTRDMPFYSVPLSPQNASSPFGTKIVEIIPNRIQVGIDRIVRRRHVKVVPRFKGTLKEGYARARTKVLPKTVSLRGPSKIVRDVSEVFTEPIMLDESLDVDFETDVSLAHIPKVTLGTETVHVSVELSRSSIERPYSDLPLHLLLPPGKPLRAAQPPPTVSVTLRGPQTVLNELNSSAIRAFVDVSDITNPGRYRVPVQIWLGTGNNVSRESVFPAMAEIELVPTTTPAVPKKADADKRKNLEKEAPADRPAGQSETPSTREPPADEASGGPESQPNESDAAAEAEQPPSLPTPDPANE